MARHQAIPPALGPEINESRYDAEAQWEVESPPYASSVESPPYASSMDRLPEVWAVIREHTERLTVLERRSRDKPSTSETRVVKSKSITSHTALPGNGGSSDENKDEVFRTGSDALALNDFMEAVFYKSDRRARHQGALAAGGILGIMSMPFGPIGMIIGGTFGALFGGSIGYVIDIHYVKRKSREFNIEMRRLKCLVRWTGQQINSVPSESTEAIRLLELLVLEFKPVAETSSQSSTARKLLSVLDTWISQKRITRLLSLYMERLLQRWREVSREDFLRSMRVFQVLITVYQHTHRTLTEQEEQLNQRIERLLLHESVILVMAHAQLYPTESETRVMECMIFADAIRNKGDQEESQPEADSSMSESMTEEEGRDDKLVDQASVEDETSNAVVTPRKKTKPFFTNWDDFMEFDVNLKHMLPITHCEFDLLLEKESESNVGWEVCVDRKEIMVSKCQTASGIVTVRAWATVPGVHPLVAFHLFANQEERMKWDKVFCTMELTDTNVKGCDVLYCVMKAAGVTPRDFLQFRRVLVQDDGTIVIVFRSAEHPSMPENKQYIRAETFISGYVLRYLEDESLGPGPHLKLYLMSCTDIKGYVPKFIINHLAPRKPAEWVESLRKAAVDFQESCPNFKEVLGPEIACFQVDNPFDYEDTPVLIPTL